MSKWLIHAIFGPRIGSKTFAHVGTLAVTVAGLGLSSVLISSIATARADEQVITTAAEEGSLLVAKREGVESPTPAMEPTGAEAVSPPADSESLEPTSQSPHHTPDLAGEGTAGTEDESQFAAALAKIAQPAPERAAASKPTSRRIARVTPDEIPHEPVKFHGISVGVSTNSELVAAWGEPADSVDTEEGIVMVYHTDPFAAVEVLVSTSGVVATIKVTLASALEPMKLAEQLALNEFEPVTVLDDAGKPLGQAFPERGVLFMFDEEDQNALEVNSTKPALVSHVAIQPLDARAFALRAENNLRGPYEQTINDLTTAIALDPDDAHAHWLLSEVYLITGQADLADAEAAAACELEPESAEYQLRRGQTLALLGEYDDAVHEIRAVLDRQEVAPIVRAQALHEMARLASLGDVQIASKAIPFETRAIEIADRAATSKDARERRAAKQLLVEAHLAVGEEIARQSFNQKVESLSLWIGRASGLAEEFIAHDGGSVELRLLIAQRALAALASFKPTLDPAPWVAEVEEAAHSLFAQSEEELWQQRIKWELGVAYLNALRVEHSRRETANALRYGQQAVENLAEGALSRQAVHSSEQLVAQLYFHMGAVYAVHQQDHMKAVPWYDKAAPLLTGPRPVSELYAPRREGEMLVSIGVTCWQLGQQARALELTRTGVNLVEMAVEDGILARSSLAVPYGNLATMYEQMGETTNAARYSDLAKSVAPTAPKQPPRITSTSPTRQTGGTTIQTNAQQRRPMQARR